MEELKENWKKNVNIAGFSSSLPIDILRNKVVV